MAAFHYKAVSAKGEIIQGTMEAAAVTEVVRKLQEAGHTPIRAESADDSAVFNLARILRAGSGPSPRDMEAFTSQMATLLGAGLPLDRALGVLHDLAENDKMRRLVGNIRDQVREGRSLSEALEAQHGVFSNLYLNMVRAGEIGGSLEHSLERLSDYMERAKSLKESVISALIYPVILLLLAGASMIILLTYVVPQFTPMFEDLGADMPMLTQVVLGIAGVLQGYWWVLALLFAAAVYFMRTQLADDQTRFVWHKRFLSTPLVGDLLRKLEMARLSRTFGTLLRNGVPVLGALSIARNVINNAVLGAAVDEARKTVKTGGSLARTLIDSGEFPALAIQMISVGEETGQLDEMLLKVADAYDIEVRVTVDRLLALMVPMLTLVLAGVIGTIVMSILMAILSVNDLVA